MVASLARNRSSLALGNIVGSTISNILGAFSLGLLFRQAEHGELVFDQSSRIYTLILLVWTTIITACAAIGSGIDFKILGGASIALFCVYVAAIAWTISRGRLVAPEELSDSDSDSDSDDEEEEEHRHRPARGGRVTDEENRVSENSPLMGNGNHNAYHAVARTSRDASPSASSVGAAPRRRHGLVYHIGFLIFGFLCIVLSSYVLSNAAAAIADYYGISDVLFGVVILAFATTLPEKFIATLSGFKGHAGILVANTVGSNIFLLSLCIGILWVSSGGQYDADQANLTELGVMLGSTVALTVTVWAGFRPAVTRCIGGVMLLAYIAFVVLEVTVIRPRT